MPLRRKRKKWKDKKEVASEEDKETTLEEDQEEIIFQEGHKKSIKLFVPTVETNVKYHSSQKKADQFTAVNVTRIIRNFNS